MTTTMKRWTRTWTWMWMWVWMRQTGDWKKEAPREVERFPEGNRYADGLPARWTEARGCDARQAAGQIERYRIFITAAHKIPHIFFWQAAPHVHCAVVTNTYKHESKKRSRFGVYVFVFFFFLLLFLYFLKKTEGGNMKHSRCTCVA